MMIGTVLWGINNIYTVEAEGRRFLCRIKGKKLPGAEGEYSPLTAGDRVVLDPSPGNEEAMILEREKRRNQIIRWNRKRNVPQALAANVDRLFVIASAQSPPFRPRFVDRVLVAAGQADVPAFIVLNKVDLGIDEETAKRLEEYRSLGYPVLPCSAQSGYGVEKVREAMGQSYAAFVGQSGAGKSTLLNALFPDLKLRTGDISRKWNRGRHTTVFAALHPTGAHSGVVDTPGIREFDLWDIDPLELQEYFPEFAPYGGQCDYTTCTHEHEPGCAVRAAVEEGRIHPDRYESYLRIMGA